MHGPPCSIYEPFGRFLFQRIRFFTKGLFAFNLVEILPHAMAWDTKEIHFVNKKQHLREETACFPEIRE